MNELMGWILVDYDLPKANTEIIYCTKNGTYVGYYDGWGHWNYFNIGGFEKAYYQHDKVIAWMPLPEPFEDEENLDDDFIILGNHDLSDDDYNVVKNHAKDILKKERKKCAACNGSGWYDNCDKHGNPIPCGSCDGTGYHE